MEGHFIANFFGNVLICFDPSIPKNTDFNDTEKLSCLYSPWYNLLRSPTRELIPELTITAENYAELISSSTVTLKF